MLKRTTRRLRGTGVFSLAPGLVDAGLGSLAGLVGALYAARFFEIDQLGLFSLFFVMFQLLGLLPARLILVPVQVVALDLRQADRVSVLARSLPLGLLAGAAAIPFVWIVAAIAPGGDRADYVAFGITTSTMILLSPLQDHVRFVLHMSDRSRSAALVSALQLAVVMVAIAGLHLGGVPGRWLPFLSLSIANGASISFALAVVRPRRSVVTSQWPGLGVLLRSGRLLLPAQLLPVLGVLGTAALVARLASTGELGAAEAARTVASPMFVAGVGLGQVLNPRIMEAARQQDRAAAQTAGWLYGGMVALFAAAYVAMVGWPHGLNLAEAAIPIAYSVGGLVAFRIAASAATVVSGIPGTALLGQGDNRGLLLAAGLALLVQLALASALAGPLGAHTVPAAELGGALALAGVTLWRVGWVGGRRSAVEPRP